MVSPARIIDLASAFYGSCVLFTASDAGVFGAIAKHGASDCQTLSALLKADPRATRLLLDACVALCLLQKDGELYKNTAESAMFLVPGAPGDLSGAIRYNRDVYTAWGKLPHFLSTGEPVESPALHLGADPARTRTFVMAMHYRALGIGRAVVPRLKLSGARRVLDIGGGPATYAMLMASSNPELSCTVIDLPDVVAIAQELIREQGMEDRVRTIAGDYHSEPFPGDNDAVTILGVLHQESPETIRELLKRACAALKPGGVIHVLDMMTDQTRARPVFSALFAVNMALTKEHGWVFSDAELKQWLEEAGLSEVEVEPLPPPMPHWLVSARKI